MEIKRSRNRNTAARTKQELKNMKPNPEQKSQHHHKGKPNNKRHYSRLELGKRHQGTDEPNDQIMSKIIN